MDAIAAAAAVLLFADASRRLVRALLPSARRGARAALTLIVGAALLCGAYGVLGQLCVRQAADIELVFHGDEIAAPRGSTTAGAGEVRVIEDRVTRARATPRSLAWIALGCAALAFVATRRGRRGTSPPPTRGTASAATPILRCALYVPLALVGIAALRSVARGYDALWYHLPMAAAFQRSGHLEPPGRDLVFYFPANMELLARTLADALGPRAMSLVQWPFALALAALTTALARRIGAGRGEWLAGALVLVCPMVVFQAGLGYADVISTAAVVAAALLASHAIAAEHARALGLSLAAGLAFGLSLGTKYAALPLVASGLAVIFLFALGGPSDGVFGGRPRLRHAPRATALLAIMLVGIGIPAWFWYARNARLTGNPIFPIAVPHLGLRGLFLPAAFNRGKELELVGSRAEWLAYPWIETLSHESGFGAAFATLVPLSLVPLGVTLAVQLCRGRTPRYALPFSWGLVYLASWWLGTPHEVRHLLPLVPLLGAPATLLLRGNRATAVGLRHAATASLAVGGVAILRLLLFSPTPELSARATEHTAFYGVSADVLAGLPAGARIANLAGRPYNFALLGPALTLAPYDYAPGLPTDGELGYRGADYVFARGSREAIAAIRARGEAPGWPWRIVHEAIVQSDRHWSFWGATTTDIVVLFRRHKEDVGVEPRGR